MAKIYYVNDGAGQKKLPIADATLTTFDNNGSDIDIGTESGVFVIAFFDAGGLPATPSAGTITPEMSPIEGQWQQAGTGDAVIDATKVIAGTATYTIPVFPGPAREGRLTFSGITGVSSAIAYFWRVQYNDRVRRVKASDNG